MNVTFVPGAVDCVSGGDMATEKSLLLTVKVKAPTPAEVPSPAPGVPVIVIAEFPSTALLAAVIVTVSGVTTGEVVLLGVKLGGLKLHVTFAGNPAHANVS